MNTHSSPQTPTHQNLQRLFDLPGVQHVLLVDHTGGCVAHLGNGTVPRTRLTEWTVLARAVFSAADELGQRSISGSCQEITQMHNHGGTLLRLVPGGLLLVVHFSASPPLGTLRLQAREVAERLASCLTAGTTARLESAASIALDVAPLGGGLFVSHEEFDEAFAPVGAESEPR
jgi:predicted regulator of Ras-like GTPase activity (Roadblock/LC7/MglB family)